MKKTLLTKKISALFFALILFSQIGIGQVLFNDNFAYTVGDFPVSPSSPWTSVNSGTTIKVVSGSLSYTGFLAGRGNSITMATGLDYNTVLSSSVTSEPVYVAFLLNVASAPTATGDYFLHLMESASSTYYKGRIWIKKGSTTSKFYIGVAKSGTTPAVAYSSSEYDAGTTYLVVLKYQNNTTTTTDDIVTLYVNPSPVTSEPASPTVTASDNTTTDATSISLVALRQGNATNAPSLTLDGLRVATTWTDAISDLTTPTVIFVPANTALGIKINAKPTITFSETVYTTSAEDITNSNVAALITFKTPNSGGTNVPFTAAIDNEKKVITVTPSSSLSFSTDYYLAVGSVEDAAGNETSASNVTFTTLASTDPSVDITSPVGGETYYAGQKLTITWTSANVTNVKIEAYAPDNNIDRNFGWTTIIPATAAAPGNVDFTIPGDSPYSTVYKIRISDIDHPAVISTGGDFTIRSVQASLSDLRTNYVTGSVKVNDVIKLTSEAIITYKSSPSFYVQDASTARSGILIYDSGNKITTSYNQYDGIKGLTGYVYLVNNMLEIIPVADPGAATSTGNTVTPVTLTASGLNSDFTIYQSMLIVINNATFADAGSNFAASTSYNITDASGTAVFFTKFSSADYIGTLIPSGAKNIAGICLQYNTTPEIASRSSADIIDYITGIEKTSVTSPVLYPVPVRDMLMIRNIANVRSVEILDATGKLIHSSNISGEDEVNVPVSYLKQGIYFLRITTPEGKITRKFIK